MKIFKLFLIFSFISAFVSCAQTPNRATQTGLIGAAIGSGAGAIIGHQTGNGGEGAVIGGALGAASGALLGNTMDAQENERQAIDEEYIRQQHELERQRREIDDLRRQQRYDDQYRRY